MKIAYTVRPETDEENLKLAQMGLAYYTASGWKQPAYPIYQVPDMPTLVKVQKAMEPPVDVMSLDRAEIVTGRYREGRPIPGREEA